MPKKLKPAEPKLSAKAAAAIDHFDEAAQRHGWEADQGTTKDVKEATAEYAAARLHLQKLVSSLEARARLYKGRYEKMAGH